MPSPEEIADQQNLLATHRRTLAHLLRQAAQYGGEVFAPPQTANGIAEARANIQRTKQVLHNWGTGVEDFPIDWDNSEPLQGSRVANSASKTFSSRALRVFLCHSSDDKPEIRQLYHRLLTDGAYPWLDEEDILPGQDWELEIPKAVRNSDVVIVCLSRTSMSKAGYIHKEIKYALDVADKQPDGTIFIIPLKLEEFEVPDRLRRWQWVNYFEERGHEKLMRALHIRAESLGIDLARSAAENPPLLNLSEHKMKMHTLDREIGFLTIDTGLLLGEQGDVRKAPSFQFSSVADLLDYVYACLNERVPEYTYTDLWFLRDRDSGHIFDDIGTKWAEANLGSKRDSRTLEQVGIVAGMLLEVIAPDGKILPPIHIPSSTTPQSTRPKRRRKLSKERDNPLQ